MAFEHSVSRADSWFCKLVWCLTGLLSVQALFSHFGAVRCVMIHQEKDVARVAELRRVREEAGKRDADVKEAVDRAKVAVEESEKKRVKAVRALGLAQVEKADLVKEVGALKVGNARLKDENLRLQKALENACQPQMEDVKRFLESAAGVELASEMRLSGGLDLLEKIQKRFPDFQFGLEDLIEEDDTTGPSNPSPNQPEPDRVAKTVVATETVAQEPDAEA